MFNFFKCKHKAKHLVVKTHKVTKIKLDSDFTEHIFHLYCNNCSQDVNINCAVIEDTSKFLRG